MDGRDVNYMYLEVAWGSQGVKERREGEERKIAEFWTSDTHENEKQMTTGVERYAQLHKQWVQNLCPEFVS